MARTRIVADYSVDPHEYRVYHGRTLKIILHDYKAARIVVKHLKAKDKEEWMTTFWTTIWEDLILHNGILTQWLTNIQSDQEKSTAS